MKKHGKACRPASMVLRGMHLKWAWSQGSPADTTRQGSRATQADNRHLQLHNSRRPCMAPSRSHKQGCLKVQQHPDLAGG